MTSPTTCPSLRTTALPRVAALRTNYPRRDTEMLAYFWRRWAVCLAVAAAVCAATCPTLLSHLGVFQGIVWTLCVGLGLSYAGALTILATAPAPRAALPAGLPADLPARTA